MRFVAGRKKDSTPTTSSAEEQKAPDGTRRTVFASVLGVMSSLLSFLLIKLLLFFTNGHSKKGEKNGTNV